MLPHAFRLSAAVSIVSGLIALLCSLRRDSAFGIGEIAKVTSFIFYASTAISIAMVLELGLIKFARIFPHYYHQWFLWVTYP